MLLLLFFFELNYSASRPKAPCHTLLSNVDDLMTPYGRGSPLVLRCTTGQDCEVHPAALTFPPLVLPRPPDFVGRVCEMRGDFKNDKYMFFFVLTRSR